tara:strand:+ start:548 stop:772 length:225 start_codon:yes stop_codon:yes gene_type:complete
MPSSLKKLLFAILLNSSLFLILMIGIQNSSSQKKVNLIIKQTIKLPVSFIIGTSFICGSLTGSILNMNFSRQTE